MLTNWLQDSEGGISVQPEWISSGVHALFSFRDKKEDSAVGLDIGFHDRLDADVTLANRRRVAKALGQELESFVFVRQVHGTDVIAVDRNHRGMGALSYEPDRIPGDALMTNEPHVTLAILTADCVPILFYDPVRRVAAAAHSGWRGTVGHICVKVVEAMRDTYGTKPKDVLVSIGPSIRKCCYEVDDKVAKEAKGQFPAGVLLPRFGRAGRYLFNMQGAIRADLEKNGVLPSHIEDTGLCTSCRVEHLFSHRREAGKAGRQVAAIVLT